MRCCLLGLLVRASATACSSREEALAAELAALRTELQGKVEELAAANAQLERQREAPEADECAAAAAMLARCADTREATTGAGSAGVAAAPTAGAPGHVRAGDLTAVTPQHDLVAIPHDRPAGVPRGPSPRDSQAVTPWGPSLPPNAPGALVDRAGRQGRPADRVAARARSGLGFGAFLEIGPRLSGRVSQVLNGDMEFRNAKLFIQVECRFPSCEMGLRAGPRAGVREAAPQSTGRDPHPPLVVPHRASALRARCLDDAF